MLFGGDTSLVDSCTDRGLMLASPGDALDRHCRYFGRKDDRALDQLWDNVGDDGRANFFCEKPEKKKIWK